MICGRATICILFYNRITLWKQISNWRFGLTGWSECDLDFIFFLTVYPEQTFPTIPR